MLERLGKQHLADMLEVPCSTPSNPYHMHTHKRACFLTHVHTHGCMHVCPLLEPSKWLSSLRISRRRLNEFSIVAATSETPERLRKPVHITTRLWKFSHEGT